MENISLNSKEVRAYIFLTSLVICGLAGSLITAPKILSFGINFPFSTIIFSILTYPIVDCICELWGKKVARQTMWIGLLSQTLLTIIIQLSIYAPYSPAYWQHQAQYHLILAAGAKIVSASLIAFSISQIMDIVVYQKLKEITQGKRLWLRSNLSTYLGQTIDSIIFVNIVFASSSHKMDILMGSILVKITLSFLMTPFVYLIIYGVNRYLNYRTLAFMVATPPHAID